MASVTSNAPEVSRSLFAVADALNLRGTSGGRRLGDEVADAASVAISVRTRDRQKQPDGTPLPKLNARYKRRKIAKGFDPRILVATGEMSEPAVVRGDVVVTSSTTTMTSGVDSHTRDLIHWAETGDANRNRPARHWIDPGPEGEAAVDTVFREAIDRAVKGA